MFSDFDISSLKTIDIFDAFCFLAFFFFFLISVQKTSIILNVASVPFIFFVLIALTFLLKVSFFAARQLDILTVCQLSPLTIFYY